MTLQTMDQQAIDAYIKGFGRRFLRSDILDTFPETKILPKYIQKHFSSAEIVLDLGCGTALWFWASFLPSLKRVDGIDLYPEFLAEADTVLDLDEVPEGYKVTHEYIGETFTKKSLQRLKAAKGALVVGDFTQNWPEPIRGPYDLVTEYGSIGEVKTNQQFITVVKRSAHAMRAGGALFFVNFLEKHIDETAKKLGRFTPDTLQLSTALYEQAVQKAGLRMVEFNTIDDPEGMPPIKTFFYGHAVK